jgi:hypothetical protein
VYFRSIYFHESQVYKAFFGFDWMYVILDYPVSGMDEQAMMSILANAKPRYKGKAALPAHKLEPKCKTQG